jgi:hypothetical protein
MSPDIVIIIPPVNNNVGELPVGGSPPLVLIGKAIGDGVSV